MPPIGAGQRHDVAAPRSLQEVGRRARRAEHQPHAARRRGRCRASRAGRVILPDKFLIRQSYWPRRHGQVRHACSALITQRRVRAAEAAIYTPAIAALRKIIVIIGAPHARSRRSALHAPGVRPFINAILIATFLPTLFAAHAHAQPPMSARHISDKCPLPGRYF